MVYPVPPHRQSEDRARHRLPGIVVPALAALVLLAPAGRAAVPAFDHIILVVMENHAFEQVTLLPYTAALMAGGSYCSSYYALTHPSQPNYIALWSGGLQGITNDTCPAPGSPLSAENLGHACEAAGITWRAYCESLPYPGSPVCTAGSGNNIYVRKHAPWTDFGNLTHANERPYSDLAADIAAGTLPRLAVVIPDQCHNTHDCSLATGDTWLSQNVPAMLDAVGPNGIVILTWDEDDNLHSNHILTLFSGAPVRADYVAQRTVNHYTLLRTIGDGLGLAPIGLAAGQVAIDDVFKGYVGVGEAPPPAATLSPPAPNPSSGRVTATFHAPRAAFVRAAVYDIAGRRVRRLLEGVVSGGRELVWDGTDDGHRSVAPGVYFLRVDGGAGHFERKIVRVGR